MTSHNLIRKLFQLFQGDISQLKSNDLKLITTYVAPVMGICRQIIEINQQQPASLEQILTPAKRLTEWNQELNRLENESELDDLVKIAQTLSTAYHDNRPIPRNHQIPTNQLVQWNETFIQDVATVLTEFAIHLESQEYNHYQRIDDYRASAHQLGKRFTDAASLLSEYAKTYPDPDQNTVKRDPFLARVMRRPPEGPKR